MTATPPCPVCGSINVSGPAYIEPTDSDVYRCRNPKCKMRWAVPRTPTKTTTPPQPQTDPPPGGGMFCPHCNTRLVMSNDN